MIIDEEAYLQHYGVKGMRWGFRKGFTTGMKPLTSLAKVTGKAAIKGSIAGTKGAAKFSWNHPKTAAVIAVGSVIAARIIKKRADQKMTEIKSSEKVQSGKEKVDKLMNNKHFTIRIEKIK